MPEYRELEVSLDQLLLDPNNYRFQDDSDFMLASERRYHEESVQKKAERRLRDEKLLQLRSSIITNGFLPIESIIVKPYQFKDQTYVVVEGNRRVAALRLIKSEIDGGVEIPAGVQDILNKIPVVVVSHESDDPTFFEALMGVRHVSGIKEWGGYQRAYLVVKLKDDRGLAVDEIADRLAMDVREVNRRYKAFKALQQMREDEEYGDLAEPGMYALFHEAVSLPIVRDWLGWDEDLACFTNESMRYAFYDLITPNNPEETGRTDPKIRTYGDVRELKDILASEAAKESLLDPRRSFLDAMALAREAHLTRSWSNKVSSTVTALEQMNFFDIVNLSSDDLLKLKRLIQVTNEIIDGHEKLTTQ